MTDRENNLQQPSVTERTYRFLGGAALGAFLVLIPLLYSLPIHWNLWQIGLVLLLPLSCGLLSSFVGKGFIDAVMRSFESSGF
ncbi:MAG: hypothetical protein WBB29_10035 [Geitlerinemataceae cyanobacterium]